MDCLCGVCRGVYRICIRDVCHAGTPIYDNSVRNGRCELAKMYNFFQKEDKICAFYNNFDKITKKTC